MASQNLQHRHGGEAQADDHDCSYGRCLIKPMGRNGDPLVRLEHILDAVLVAAIVFFAVVLGDVLLSLLGGEPAYLTLTDIVDRSPTAVIAFGLTFFFQWARARGIDVLEWWRRTSSE